MATEKRLIDANAIVVPKLDMKGRDLFNQGYCQGKTDGILEVKVLAPTVDAVEVVCCKDCKFGDMCSIREVMACTVPDGYCWRGERKAK